MRQCLVKRTRFRKDVLPCISPEEGESVTRARGQNNRHNTETVDGKIELWTKLNCALLVRARELFLVLQRRENVANHIMVCFVLRGIFSKNNRSVCENDMVLRGRERERILSCANKKLRTLFPYQYPYASCAADMQRSLLDDSAPFLVSVVGSWNTEKGNNSFFNSPRFSDTISFKLNYFRLKNSS